MVRCVGLLDWIFGAGFWSYGGGVLRLKPAPGVVRRGTGRCRHERRGCKRRRRPWRRREASRPSGA